MKVVRSLFFIILIAVLTISLIFVMGSGYGSHNVLPDIPVGSRSADLSHTSFQIDGRPTLAPVHVESYVKMKGLERFTYESNDLQGPQKSKFAYITLIHGIDNTFTYRGFLYNALIMKKSLASLGSTADFIVMLGFTTQGDELDYHLFAKDISLLQKAGMRVIFLPRLRPLNKKVKFTEMALLKITPWNLTMYDKIQYMDGDVLPITLMDCYFNLEQNTFNTGNASPLNSGWFVAIPNAMIYNKMYEKAVDRLDYPWDTTRGWGTMMLRGIKYRSGKKAVKDWDFNGASLDQGLLFDTYALHGTTLLLDTTEGLEYIEGEARKVDFDKIFESCNGVPPIDSFIHYTGKNKPWLQEDLNKSKDKTLRRWKDLLDELQLPINSTNYHLLGTKPPLGYFAANK